MNRSKHTAYLSAEALTEVLVTGLIEAAGLSDMPDDSGLPEWVRTRDDVDHIDIVLHQYGDDARSRYYRIRFVRKECHGNLDG